MLRRRDAQHYPSPCPRLLALLFLAVVGLVGPVGCRDKTGPSPADDTSGPGDCALGPRATTWAAFCPGGEESVARVQPIIGTQGSGNAIPGPMRPHGFVKLSPDSLVESGSIDAYEYDATSIEGFSHTHLEGPGGSLNGYSQILLQPFTGEPSADPERYASTFDHATEVAEVGYYAVTLADDDVRVELAATEHAGLQRYTFPAGAAPRVLLDLGHSRGTSIDGSLTIVDDSTVEGYGAYNTHPLLSALLANAPGVTADSTVYYSLRFSRPMLDHGLWSGEGAQAVFVSDTEQIDGPWIGGWFELEPGADPVEVRVGLSLVSVDQARAHREEEADGVSLEAARAATRAAWGCLLSRVQVEGGTEDQQTELYTALYHSFMQPTDFTESNGQFVSGAAGVVETSDLCEGRHYYADDWCMWDTYRTLHPLMTLVEPEIVDDQVASMLHLYDQGGWLPKCTWMSTGYSRVMTGNPAVPIIADAYVKGFRDYDADKAWAAVEKTGTQDTEDFVLEPLCGYLDLGTVPDYLDLGYVSHQCDQDQSASSTMEYAFDDWSTARLAEAMGRTDSAASFQARSDNWRNQWDAEVGFVRGRNRDGSWVEPFDPTSGTDFVESNAWIFTFFVPQDPEGLVDTLGGQAAFTDKLDTFFDEGHFDPTNEPSFHIPLLYNHAGAAWRSQERVRDVLDTDFAVSPGGLPGNDDAGATSAWYALLAMGLYPMAPGDGHYEITTPLFDRVQIQLPPELGGQTFTVEAPRTSADEIYIQAASLNGAALDRSYITQDEITAGGTLSLSLGAAPGSWP